MSRFISSNPNYVVEYGTDDFYGFEFGEEWEQDLQVFDYLGKSWGWEVIRTFDAWWYMDKIKTNGNSMDPVRVGLIDCGFDESHEDLKFAEVHYNKTAIDRRHGTHVAGTMAAISDNKIGICGVYPYGKNNLYAVADGGIPKNGGVSKYAENGTFWSSAMGQKIAFSELILRNVKVINQSMGFNFYQSKDFKNKFGNIDYKALRKFWNDSSNFNEYIENAKILGDFLHRLIENGHEFVIISSAGNDSDKSIGHLEAKYSSWNNMIRYEDYPDVYNRIIVVGAVDKKYNMRSSSNAGSRVDVFAPGETIFSTVPNDKYDDNMSGTSMAAPHVSGVAALVWTVNNDLTGAEVKSIICDDSNRSNIVKSCKMVDAYNCVVVASNTQNNTKLYDKKNGGVLNFVVDKDNESIRIEGAKVTAMKGSEIVSTTQTDQYGHFELILPAGIYDIIVEKESYDTYTWSNITVKSGEVNYLSDWPKLELKKIEDSESSDEWKKIYFDVLMNYLNNDRRGFGFPAFDLYDVDDDGVLELFITSDGAHYCDEYIYTIKNGEAVQIDGYYSDYGTWYIKNGCVFSLHFINGGYEDHCLWRKKGTQVISECNYTSNDGAVPESEVEYRINDSIVSKEEYKNKFNEKISGSTSIGRKYDLNSQTISYVLGVSTFHLSEYHDEKEHYLRSAIEERGTLAVWEYADYDGNGEKEAFAITTTEDDEIKAVYFVDSNCNVSVMQTSFDGLCYYESGEGYYRMHAGKGFFWCNYGAHGSGYHTMLYSVKDGTPYSLDIASQLQGFYQDGESLYTIEDSFDAGYHQWFKKELVYDSATQQFRKGRVLGELD